MAGELAALNRTMITTRTARISTQFMPAHLRRRQLFNSASEFSRQAVAWASLCKVSHVVILGRRQFARRSRLEVRDRGADPPADPAAALPVAAARWARPALGGGDC